MAKYCTSSITSGITYEITICVLGFTIKLITINPDGSSIKGGWVICKITIAGSSLIYGTTIGFSSVACKSTIISITIKFCTAIMFSSVAWKNTIVGTTAHHCTAIKCSIIDKCAPICSNIPNSTSIIGGRIAYESTVICIVSFWATIYGTSMPFSSVAYEGTIGRITIKDCSTTIVGMVLGENTV